VDAPVAVPGKEQHVQAAQEDGIDVEEVHGQDRLRLGPAGTHARSARTGGARDMPASLKISHTVDGATV
jgi:hypothetical protein